MLFLMSIVLFLSLALDGQASSIELQIPQPVKTLMTDSVCAVKGSIVMPHFHDHNHNHDDVCLQGAQFKESNLVKAAKWTIDPICKSYPKGNFCIYANASFAEGRGILLITTPSVAEELSKIPAFTTHQNTKAIASPSFEVQPLPGRGFGIVANKTIERGDKIVAYTPIVAVHGDAFHAPEDTNYTFFNSALEYLPSMSLALYTKLAAHFDKNDVNWERLNTNSFSEEFGGAEHWIVLPETARINHDCRPNAIYYFDEETMTHHVHATRRIYAGEEITITYTSPLQTQKQRARALKRSWGFECTCSLCQAPPESVLESNRRIKTIITLSEQLEDFSPASLATPEAGELLISLYELERLDSSIADAYLLTSMAYNAVGNDWKTVEYAMKAMEASMINYGPKSEEVRRAKKLMLDPRSHESWRARR